MTWASGIAAETAVVLPGETATQLLPGLHLRLLQRVYEGAGETAAKTDTWTEEVVGLKKAGDGRAVCVCVWGVCVWVCVCG